MALAAQNGADRVDQLITLTGRLTELASAQALALEQRRPQEAMQLVEEMAKLANIYRHESARIRGKPELIADAPASERLRLRRATEALDAVLARQARALEAAKTVTEGVVRAIAEEVAAQRQRRAGSAYGPSAKTTAKPADGTAITLNRRA